MSRPLRRQTVWTSPSVHRPFRRGPLSGWSRYCSRFYTSSGTSWNHHANRSKDFCAIWSSRHPPLSPLHSRRRTRTPEDGVVVPPWNHLSTTLDCRTLSSDRRPWPPLSVQGTPGTRRGPEETPVDPDTRGIVGRGWEVGGGRHVFLPSRPPTWCQGWWSCPSLPSRRREQGWISSTGRVVCGGRWVEEQSTGRLRSDTNSR